MPTYLDLLAELGIGGAHPGGFALTKCLLERELPLFGKKILDAGCGTGQTLYYLEQLGADATGMDIDPRMIKKAKKRMLNTSVSLITGDIESLPFQGQSFEYVLCESVAAFTNTEKSLSELKRVLKPNGILLLTEMTASENMDENEKIEFTAFYKVPALLTQTQWRKRLDTAGFTEIDAFAMQDFDLDFSESLTEFDIDKNVEPVYYELLDRHDALTLKFKDKITCMVYRCCTPPIF
ncbi:class I SAM-dependent methyltransferase [Metabacillus sp. RGM 3146]|uniref:class I SAM-dependent methyltransferase n=1 Tax=Metabacillus sp. RGM 3146 TaxID=3401092 RepID=UPI003B9D576F